MEDQFLMKITWLGQAGLLFDCGGFKIIIDPYLSDSAEKRNPKSKRRMPIPNDLFDVTPDVMIFTHDHIDHYDDETVERFIGENTKITVLAPASVWGKVRARAGANNYVLFNRYTEWTEGGITFSAVKAEHSDPSAIGVIIDDGCKRYYVTGDTLYNEEIFGDIKGRIDTLFLPINGVGNNMNMIDAVRFAERIGAVNVVPIHFGMFDNLNPHNFNLTNKIIPEYLKEIEIK